MGNPIPFVCPMMTVNKVRNELKCHSELQLYTHTWAAAWQPWKGLSDATQLSQGSNPRQGLKLEMLVISFIYLPWYMDFSFLYTHTHRQTERTYFINYLSQLIALCVCGCVLCKEQVIVDGNKNDKIPYELSPPEKGKLFPIHLQHIFSSFCKTLSPLNVRRVVTGRVGDNCLSLSLSVCLSRSPPLAWQGQKDAPGWQIIWWDTTYVQTTFVRSLI